MKKLILLTGMVIILLHALGITVHPYEVETHRRLNENAADQSGVDGYLKGQLRLNSGLEEKFNKKTAKEWIGEGGVFEDSGLRFFRHFHNPLASWEDAGFKGINDSSLLWAQRSLREQGWSWHDAREYYYQALTSTSAEDRETAFAHTFQALGQIIHLIEDASVPEHTRDDAHAVFYSFEDWAVENQDKNFFIQWLGNPIHSTMLLDTSVDSLVPITHLWDTDQYQGVVPPTGTDVGMAEYSNANFVSKDSIFVEDVLPFPSRIHVELWTDEENSRQYFRKVGEGEAIEHLVITSWLYFYRLRYFLQYDQYLPVSLDERCYSDQAQFLVPRAVGYSARLLDYFFRGQVETKEAELNAGRNQITVRLKNTTPGEVMGPGQAVIVVQYAPLDRGEAIYQASAEASISTPLPTADYSEPYTFYFSSSIPTDVKDLSFTLVYRGWLGAEADAVVGQVIETGQPYIFVVQDTLITPFDPTEEVYSSGGSDISEPCCMAASVYEMKRRYWNRTQTVAGRFISRNVSDTEVIVRITAERVDPWYRTPAFYINGVKISKFNRSGYAVWEQGDTPEPPTTWMIDGISSFTLFPHFFLEVQLTDGTLIKQRILTLHAIPDQTTEKSYEKWMAVDEDGEPITWEIFYRDAYRETFADLWVTPGSEKGLQVTLAAGGSLQLTLREQFDGPFNFVLDNIVPGEGNLDDVPFLDYLPIPETLPSFVRRYSEKELEFLGGLGISPEAYTITWSAPR